MTESTTNGEHLALWGGCFKSGPSPELARLSKSTQFDWRLADDDIAGSRAHARALGRAGLLTADELQRMEDALDELQRCVDSGAFARSRMTRTRPLHSNAACFKSQVTNSAASSAPAVPATIRSPRSSACGCAATAASSPKCCSVSPQH